MELKWAGAPLTLPNVIIPAAAMWRFDCFKIRHDRPTAIEFYTLTDATEFSPVISAPGTYDITYCVSSSSMTLVRRTVRIEHPGEIKGIKILG